MPNWYIKQKDSTDPLTPLYNPLKNFYENHALSESELNLYTEAKDISVLAQIILVYLYQWEDRNEPTNTKVHVPRGCFESKSYKLAENELYYLRLIGITYWKREQYVHITQRGYELVSLTQRAAKIPHLDNINNTRYIKIV
jgi:hypothetical protein